MGRQNRQRDDVIDFARGAGQLGILLENLQVFAILGLAVVNPMVQGPLSSGDLAVWLVNELFVAQKLMALFVLLLGAGMIATPVAAHRRRMWRLALFGMAHTLLLARGDVLFPYALCGLLVHPLRHWPARRLLSVGVALWLVPPIIMGFASLLPLEIFGPLPEAWHLAPEAAAREIAIYRSSLWQQLPHRLSEVWHVQIELFVFRTGWKVAGLMLFGMGLGKLGLFGVGRRRRVHVFGAVVGSALGLGLSALGAYLNFARGWSFSFSFFFGTQFSHLAALPGALGYLCLAQLLHRPSGRIMQLVCTLGRTALSHYLLQSLLCAFIFYGHGLALMGQVSRVGAAGITLAIWGFQLLVVHAWPNVAPLERLLRASGSIRVLFRTRGGARARLGVTRDVFVERRLRIIERT